MTDTQQTPKNLKHFTRIHKINTLSLSPNTMQIHTRRHQKQNPRKNKH